MQAFLQQLPTLIGVLVGALATFTATSVAERSRWRRTQSVRWDDKRLAAYAEYAHAVKKVISISVRLAAHQGIHQDLDKLAPEEGLGALALAEEERTMKWETILLLGTDHTVVAARAWHDSVFRLQRIASGVDVESSWGDAVGAVSRARRGFYEAAKADIGITVGDAPESYEWQLAKLVPAKPTIAAEERGTLPRASDS
ncbi:hypothetical protein [Actinokineospora sp.]|uniref:hypothetical protein n=1 Tax=Actinokineospora sp. TaxID=1872133 RepID=UPI003D6B562D